MRDALHEFGTIDNAGAAADYDAESHLNLGALDGNFRLDTHRDGAIEDLVIVFQCTEAVDASTIVAFVSDSADDSTFAKILTSGAGITTPAVGDRIVIPFPKKSRQYLKAGVTTGDVTTTGEWEAWVERGANVPA